MPLAEPGSAAAQPKGGFDFEFCLFRGSFELLGGGGLGRGESQRQHLPHSGSFAVKQSGFFHFL